MNAQKVTTRITRLSGSFFGALGIMAGFIATPPQALVAAAPESIGVESLVRLGPGVAPEGLALASTRVSADGEPAEHRVAVIWSTQSDLRGRLIEVGPSGSGGSATGDPLSLPNGVGLAVAFDEDHGLVVASRPGAHADEIALDRFDETGAAIDTEVAEVPTSDPLAVDFFADGRVAVASAGEASTSAGAWIFSPEGVELASTSLAPEPGLTNVAISGPRVSVHGDELLVGWDRLANCGGSGGSGKRCHSALVGRLNDDAELVKQLRRFASDGANRNNKALRFLGGPSDVGSVAVFEDTQRAPVHHRSATPERSRFRARDRGWRNHRRGGDG